LKCVIHATSDQNLKESYGLLKAAMDSGLTCTRDTV